MNICKEFDLDDLMAVCAIPVGNISAASPGSPANELVPVFHDEDIKNIQDVFAGSVTIGLQARAGGTLVPIMRGTGKAKDDESDSVAGRLHTVTVGCEADDRDSAAWERLFALERTPRHLLLAFRGGTLAFVSATEDTYLCTVERDGAKTSVQFRIQNLMGIQLLL